MKKSPLKLLYTVACRYLPAYTMRAAKIKRARWLFSAVMAVRAQPPPAIRRKSPSFIAGILVAAVSHRLFTAQKRLRG